MPITPDFPVPPSALPDGSDEKTREIALNNSTNETQQKLFALLNAFEPFSPKTFTDHDGRRLEALISTISDGVGGGSFWGITVVDSGLGTFKLALNGASILPPGKVNDSDAYGIAGFDTIFAISSGKILFLESTKLTGGDISATLKYEDMGGAGKEVYTTKTDSGGNTIMDKYRYPLYSTVDTSVTTGGVFTEVGNNLKLKRLVGDTAFAVHEIVHKDDTNTIPFIGIIFLPSFASVEQ